MLLRTEDCVRDREPTDVMEEVGLCWALWEWIELSLLDLKHTRQLSTSHQGLILQSLTVGKFTFSHLKIDHLESPITPNCIWEENVNVHMARHYKHRS